MTRKKKIFLADDDADDREIFENMLSKKPDVELLHSVENGREVLEWLGQRSAPNELPDLIVLDHNMPMMNGTETLEAIKSTPQYQEILVVIYSTYSDARLTGRCKDLGAAMVLAKPSSLKEYEAVIETFLSLLH